MQPKFRSQEPGTSGMEMVLTSREEVPWPENLVLKAQLGISTPLCVGGRVIYVHPQRLMDSIGFQNALRDLRPSNTSLDELVGDWNSCFSEAIDEVAPQCPLCSHSRLSPWYTVELRGKKQVDDLSEFGSILVMRLQGHLIGHL